MFVKKTHIVPDGVSDIRFSEYARKIFISIPSRNGIYKAIKRGKLLIDGKKAETGRWMKPGQKLELVDLETNLPKGYRLDFEIIYEDQHIVIINKPAGIEVSGNKFKTIENAMMDKVSQSSEEDALPWARPVHRLDSPTSGLLIAAKTQRAQINLGQQFQDKIIRKRYRAVVIGKPAAEGEINSPIEGREAVSKFNLIKNVPSLKNDTLSLIDLFPLTGRTHQLRIHMSELGFPILGDKLYGKEGMILISKGLFLCAVELSLKHPISNELMNIKIDEPEKFKTFMDREQRRWEKYN